MVKIKYRIQFQYLHKPELIYEVSIRGETPGKTCAELRKQMSVLRKTLPPDAVKVSTYSFDEDYKGISKTLKTINKNINLLQKCYMNVVAMQTLSMLNHLYYRVQRWVNGPNSPQRKAAVKEIKKRSKRLMRRFSSVSDNRSDGGSSVRVVEEG